MRRLHVLCCFCGILAASPGASIATASTKERTRASAASFTLPDTTVGKLAKELVRVINGGDAQAQREFIHKRFLDSRQDAGAVAEHLQLMRRIHEQGGGVEPASIEKQTPRELRFLAQGKRNRRWLRIFLAIDSQDSGRMLGFGALPGRDPQQKSEPWPTAPLDESAVVAAIAQQVHRRADEDRFSGVVLVAKGKEDRVLFHKAYGLADRDFNVANQLTTKFHLGSMPKMFTSLCIFRLIDAGKLSLDDSLSKVLPDYPNREAAAKITIRMLLSHTSGLGGFFDRPGFDTRKQYGNHQEMWSLFAKEPLFFAPGASSSYSNEGYLVLGAVIEKLTGQNYLDAVREQIYRPLGMRDTDSYATDEVVPNRAVGYARFEDDVFGAGPRHPNWARVQWRGNACGGAYSTTTDLLNFARGLRDGRIVSRSTADRISSPQGTMPDYGFGFQTRTVNGKSVRGHSGGGPNHGINSDLQLFWDDSYTVIVLGNYDSPAAQSLAKEIVEFLSVQTR